MSDDDRDQTKTSRKTALITGASAGLGREYALFAADGHDVVLIARREDRLAEVAEEVQDAHGISAVVLAADLAEPGAVQEIYEAVTERGLAIEFLVNNAGFGSNGVFAELPMDRELTMIQVNITALTELTRRFLPAMIERGSGRILNIGSTAGFQAGPFMTTYYATKAYVNHFTEGLAHELRGTGVTATVSCPGPTETEFAGIAGNEKSSLFQGGGAATAEDVARHGYRAMLAGKRMAVFGFKNKLGVQALRFGPRGMAHKIASKLNQAKE
jgi:hypothetical protein